MRGGCLFCEIAVGAASSWLVMRNERAMAILDTNPAGLGHTLVIPTRHVAQIWELEEGDADEVWRLTIRVARRLKEALEPEGLTLFQANGGAGWQQVPHLHIHLIPRWKGDGLTKPWRGVPEDQARLEQLSEQLRDP